MTTVILDILDDRALNLLKDLEELKIIRIRPEVAVGRRFLNLAAKYSGAMTKQTPEEIDKQIGALRNEWD